MRITKQTAELVAKKVLARKLADYDKELADFKVYVYNAVYNQLPDMVKKTFEKHRTFFRLSTLFKFRSDSSESDDYTTYYASAALPEGSSQYCIVIPEQDLTYIRTADKKVKNLKTEYNKSFEELVTALMQLGTYKRIKTELPELEKYLPADNVTALVPNMDKIRELIKVQ